MPPAAPSVVIFDGVCNLCDAAVNFIIARDPAGRFHFASNTSAAAKALLHQCGFPADAPPQTIVLVEPDGRCHTKSSAALRIACRLSGAWFVLYAGIVVPRPLRDWAYDWVARHRYRWFGRRESCRMPAPELKARFLA